MCVPTTNTFLAYLLPALAAAAPISLPFSVECIGGTTPFVQQYVDHSSAPGVEDFTCGPLTCSGHQPPDICLAILRQIAAGVPVSVAICDGLADALSGRPEPPAIEGSDCGKGNVMNHGCRWRTEYRHRHRDPVRVHTGDSDKAVTPLRPFGMSDRTRFPHLHLSMRENGRVINPFAPDTPKSSIERPQHRTGAKAEGDST